MPIIARTEDDGTDVSFLPVPESKRHFIPLSKFGSITTSARVWGFVADVNYEVIRLAVAPTTISSGTLKVDLLVNGTSILATKATATAADVPVPATFSSTRIVNGATVLIATTSDSSTVTDILGCFIIRPLLGMRERNV